MRVQLSELLRSDLQEIASYIAEHSPRYSLETVRRLRREFLTIAANPFLFRLRPELGVDLRKATVGQYVILYRIVEGTVYMERVIHGMRDLPRQLQ